MNSAFRLALSAAVGCVVLPACSAEPEASETFGTVELAVAEAPADALCLRVTFDGSRDVTRLLPLTPGKAQSFVESRLPVGLVTVDAESFAKSCSEIASNTAPSFTLESPLSVNVRAQGVTRVTLNLVRSGRIGVDIDFEDDPAGEGRLPVSLAVIGDTPYGAAQLTQFPTLIQHINGAGVDAVVHVGDIKNGSTRCDTSYFEIIADHFTEFTRPLIYTPGDNEWTDCHRANNGAYDPLERLDALRRIFFANPGVTLGEPMAVSTQASIPAHSTFVENVLWLQSSVVFAAIHAVGSNNGRAAWFVNAPTGSPQDDPDRRLAEVEARTAAAVEWIGRSFDLAEREAAPGVVIFMQADTFRGASTGFVEIVQTLAERARRYAKPVLLVQGDSHEYLVDAPLSSGSEAYGIPEPVPNLTRIVVEGETASEWLELNVDPASAEPFSWERRTVPALTTPSAG